MKVLKIFSSLFITFAISACSSTAQVNFEPQNNHYYTKDFIHSEFTVYHKGSVKKSASTDQQLMFSLLNRPMPEDQRMMLAFAEHQERYLPDSTIVGIQIKGHKRTEETKERVSSNYAHVIEQDINAVMISAMPR
ncbi:hypothetical protein [Colwellia sp. 12G3]|uniref:hypothetical protein n=1 Tax=Colwellia sp. 12G3 TaxID=2058299 RepID=UPI000C34ABF3|nr:hypothetical protein [Colwellia sp. 12G3]PKI14714.1 hypothetical protein CXF71_13210 [Colwellia sp. 12G3]